MSKNIIDAIVNLVEHPIIHVAKTYKSNNRANNAGDALEEYVQDLFANTFNDPETDRLKKRAKVLSYLGNSSNPPDMMLKGGDAIEVKKIESAGTALNLNSSYPKQKLKSTSKQISKACRDAEAWQEKDMIYVVGVIPKGSGDLESLCMVYGANYCATEECYAGIKARIKESVEATPGIEFAESDELGHVNKVDPLGITYLRVRGMWGIVNPWKAFEYIYKRPENKFSFMCIIGADKWKNLSNRQKLIDLVGHVEGLEISDALVKNPDNPAKLDSVKLIKFSHEKE